MVAKIARGTSVEGMVLYNHNKTLGKNGRQPTALLLGFNAMPGGDYQSIIRTIYRQNLLNENIQRPNLHISLNFHKKDILSNEAIYNIANRYMEEMGYNEQPYAVFRHFDTDHPHVHVVSTQIDHFGKFINDSYIFRKSERVNRKLENEFGITKAVNHQTRMKHEDLNLCIAEYLKEGRGPLVTTLREVIDDVLKSRPVSIDEFDLMLKAFQVVRTKVPKGEGGHVFNIVELDQLELDKRKSPHSGVVGAEIGTDYTLQAILKTIELNQKGKEKVKRNIQGRTYSITNELTSPIKLSEFGLRLKKKGIDLKIKRKQTGSDTGSIYGLLFIDLKTGFRYSASELKYRTIDLLSNLIDDEPDLHTTSIDDDLEKIPYRETDTDETDIDLGEPVAMEIDFGSILSSFSSIFDSNYAHSEENELLMKKKKKRKKRKK